MNKKIYVVMLIAILALTGCEKAQGSDNSVRGGDTQPTKNIEVDGTQSESTQPAQIETEQPIQIESLELTGTIIDGTVDFKNPTIMVDVLNFTYDVVCFELADYATEDWMTKYAPGTKVSIICLDDFDYTEEHAPHMATLVSVDVIETSAQWQSSMQQNSKGENSENSLAYLETIQDNILQAVHNKELTFVSSCTVNEALLVVKVGITEMKDEYIQRLKEFENMGPALDIFQQEFPILKQAPKLSITNGQESLALSGGTGEWNYRVEGDEWRGYVACGMHPVQVRYEEGVNILDSLDGSFVLSFDSEPDSVRVTVWEETAETDAEEFTEGMLLNTQKEEEGGWSFTLLQEGELVCEIFAEWEGEDYNGNSSYCVLLHN